MSTEGDITLSSTNNAYNKNLQNSRSSEYNTLEKLLPTWLQEVTVLTELLAGYEYLASNFIKPKIEELKDLSSIRDKNGEYKSLDILQKRAYELGVKININNWTKNQVGRLIENYSKYSEVMTSEELLGDFIGSILNVAVIIEKLWAKGSIELDYQDLTPSSLIEDVQKITSFRDVEAPLGFFYPTSTYNIYYDLSNLTDTSEESIKEFEQKIKDLFYVLAPLNYLVKSVSSRILTSYKYLYVGAVNSFEDRYYFASSLTIGNPYYTKQEMDELLDLYLGVVDIRDNSNLIFNTNTKIVELRNKSVEKSQINSSLFLEGSIKESNTSNNEFISEKQLSTALDLYLEELVTSSSDSFEVLVQEVLEEI